TPDTRHLAEHPERSERASPVPFTPASASDFVPGPRRIVIKIEPTGDTERDKRRLRHVHGLLTSFPGADRFVLLVYERQNWHELDFPNDTTGYSPALAAQLREYLGADAATVRPLQSPR
ncbi:MAG: hypothetical protein HY260_12130, partial [Chloroflexi bacterium]|nr:hypothetical protein [Chloroflexota bacterium]